MKKVKSIARFNENLTSTQLNKVAGGAGATEYIILLILRNEDQKDEMTKRS